MVESTTKRRTYFAFIRHGERSDAVAMTQENKPPYNSNISLDPALTATGI